jgi:hypothetical protein
MAGDFQLEEGVAFGNWLHEQIAEAVYFEMEPWALDRVRRVTERLQTGRSGAEALIVEIPWFDEVSAFTAPGRYIYFGRRLFERCACDDHAAFVVAHEMAHHDLGHVELFASYASKLTGLPGAKLFALIFHAMERRLYGPEKECDADRYALDLCVARGYSGERCLELFDVLEQHALDLGDLDLVYGPDESDDELDENASWKTKAQIWAWQRKRGYLPIRDRRQMLRNYLLKRTAVRNEEHAR